jgi:hypothetical protein
MLLALVLASAPAPPAFAQDADEVAAEVRDLGFFIEEGLSADPSAISEDVARARNGGLRFGVVLLDADPPGGAVTFAEAVLDRIGGGTVLVLSATGEGMVSTEVDQTAIDRALDRGAEAAGSAPVGQGDEAYVDAAVGSLLSTSGRGDDEPASGGGSGIFILVAIVGGLVLLVWFAMRKSKKSSAASHARQVDTARTEIRSQLDAMANILLEITDLVSASTTSQDDTYLRQASATYTEAEEAYGVATDLRALEDLADRLGEARWQLDAAAAIASGKEPPPQPPQEQRYQCFFDPTHGNATETAEIVTPAGRKTVRVCKEDAEKLRRGAQPQPRMIDVQGQRVPAPMAPKSHGGGGLDWLETFSILAGGAGQAASYDWGRPRRTTTARTSSTSTPSSPTRRSPPSTSSGTRARAGRTRRRKR